MRAKDFINEDEWDRIKPGDLPKRAPLTKTPRQKQKLVPIDTYPSSPEARELRNLRHDREEAARRGTIIKGTDGTVGSNWAYDNPPAAPIPQEKRIEINPKFGLGTKDKEWVMPDKPFSDEYATVAKERPIGTLDRMPSKDIEKLNIDDYSDFNPKSSRKRM